MDKLLRPEICIGLSALILIFLILRRWGKFTRLLASIFIFNLAFYNFIQVSIEPLWKKLLPLGIILFLLVGDRIKGKKNLVRGILILGLGLTYGQFYMIFK